MARHGRPLAPALTRGAETATVVLLLTGSFLVFMAPVSRAVTNPTTTITVGSNPDAEVFDSTNGEVYVLNQLSSSVTPIDTSTDAAGTSINVVTQGSLSWCDQAVAFDPGNNYIFVSSQGGSDFSIIDASTNTLVSHTAPAHAVSLCDILYDPANGYMYISDDCTSTTCNSSQMQVYVYSGATYKTTITVSSGYAALALGYSPSNSEVYAAGHGSTSWIALAISSSNTVSATVTMSGDCHQFVYSPATTEMYCSFYGGSVIEYIPSSNSAASSSTVPPQTSCTPAIWGMAYSPVRRSVYFVDQGCALVYMLDSSNTLSTPISGLASTTTQLQSLAYDPASGNLLIVGTGAGNVYVASPKDVVTADFSIGTSPYPIAYASSSLEVYIANMGSGTVSAVASSITVSVGNGPNAVAYSPASTDLYVTNSASGTVSAIADDNTIAATITVGSNPTALSFDSSNNDIYVANTGSGSLTPIPTNNIPATAIGLGFTTGGPSNLVFDPSNGYIYASDSAANQVAIVNGATNTLVTTVTLSNAPTAMIYDSQSTDVYVLESSGSLVMYTSGTAFTGISVASSPTAIALDNGSKNLYVISPSSGTLSKISPTTNTVVATKSISTAADSVTWFPGSTDLIAVTAGTTSGSLALYMASSLTSSGTLTVGSNPNSALWNGYVGMSVSNNGSATVTIVTGPGSVLGTVIVDTGPNALALDLANGDIYVACYGGGTVDVV